MGCEEDPVKKSQVVDAGVANITQNVRCTECGSQAIEDSQADIDILFASASTKTSPTVELLGWIIDHGRLNTCDLIRRRYHYAVSPCTGLIRDEFHAGKSDKEIYKKLEEDFEFHEDFL
ncbi:hypothetical protein ACLB2K_059163 [Fragaria x ananassa]